MIRALCVTLILLTAGSVFSQADLKAVQPVVEVSGNTMVISPPPKHHFNLEAPNTVKWGPKAIKINAAEEKIETELPAKMGVATGKVFICDEKKSYCVDRSITYVHRPGRTQEKSKTPTAPAAGSDKSISVAESANVKAYYDKVTGFHMNQIEAAFAEAKKKNLPLLIDFYGIWCPPCNQLDFQVFSDPDFQSFLKKHYVGLKLDSDAELSKELMTKYNIKFFPTMVATTPDGDEITRIIGFREKGPLTQALLQAFETREKSFKTLVAGADKGEEEAQIALGSLYLERLEFGDALKWLGKFEGQWRKAKSPLLEKVHRARYGAAANNEDKIDAAEEWLEEFPESIHALLIYDELADLYDEAKKERKKRSTIERAIAVGEKWKTKSAADFLGTDFTKGDLHMMMAAWHEKLGNADLVKAAYADCNQYYLGQVKDKKGFGRGEELSRAYCLRKSGQLEEAAKIYKKGMDLYPKDFTFFLGMGRLQAEDMKDSAESEKYFRQALDKAYGNQRIRTAIYLTQSLEKQQRETEALKVLLKEMSQIADPREKPYQRLKTRLVELETKLQSPEEAKKQ